MKNAKPITTPTYTVPDPPHIGSMLAALYKARKVRGAPLARAMGIRQDSLKRYERQHSIQYAILWRLSHILRHNLFADIAAQLPPDFATYAPVDTTLEDRIAVLEAQLAKVTAERDVLISVLKKDS